MEKFDYKENARINREKRRNDPVMLRTKEICESEVGVFRLLDEFVMHIRLGREPDYIDDIELEPMLGPEGINDFLPIEQRRDVMKINRQVMDKIYDRYHVNPVLEMARVSFRSSVYDIQPARFMGKSGATSYHDNGNLRVTIEQFGRPGLKFVEKYDYGLRENPQIEVNSSRTGLHISTSGSLSAATPYRFEFGVSKALGSRLGIRPE